MVFPVRGLAPGLARITLNPKPGVPRSQPKDGGESRGLQDPDPIRLLFNQRYEENNGFATMIGGNHYDVLAQRPVRLPGAAT